MGHVLEVGTRTCCGHEEGRERERERERVVCV